MKKNYSNKWNKSNQVRKQRKYRHNSPLHIKHKFLSAHLSKLLRKKYNKRSLPLRKGDEVLVVRGSFKKKRAKVSSVDLRNSIVYLEGIQRTKKEGSKVNIPFNPRSLQIESLYSDDKKRLPQVSEKIKE